MSRDRSARSGRMDPDRWLATWWGRWAIVLLLVLLATAVTAAQRYEFATQRPGSDVELLDLVARQFASWAIWAIVGALALRLAGWLFAHSGSLLAVVAFQLPFSLVVASSMAYVDTWIGGQPRGGRGRFERGIERGFDSARRRLTFRLPSNLFIYWVVLGLGAGAQVYRRTRREERRASELELRAARLDIELADAQMASLRAQLHPHFLFNALHTVGGLVREGRDEDALKTLAGLGELLRTTLDHGEEHELRLADELRVARRYLEIECRRFGARLAVEWRIDDGCDDARVPALFLLPLVENAVQHGVAPRTEGGRVRVSVRREGAELVVEVEDDGPGFPASLLASGPLASDGKGRRCIGLSNDRDRIAMLYGDEQRFELENLPTGGARVRVRLPFRSAEATDGDA